VNAPPATFPDPETSVRLLLRLASPALALCLPWGIARAAGTIDVSFDIKPTSCPNPFNPPLESYLTETVPTAVLGSPDFDVSNVQANSLVLVVPGGGGLQAGGTYIYPTRTGTEDVATPVDDPAWCACTTDGPDGYLDLTAKFDADDIAAALGNIWGGQRIPLCIEGELLDGTPFRGCDCIVIVGPISVESGTWGRTKATYR